MSIRVITFGGRLCAIRLPDRRGNASDVLLGFDSLDGYLKDKFYFGAVIGRYANRIPEGRFALGGREYQLPLNHPHWTLHGGKRGFDQALWSSDLSLSQNTLRLTHVDPHLAQGFPGALRVTVTFRVEEPFTLRIDYEADTDRPTIINLTQHPYFNLAGLGRDVLGHVVTIEANQFVEIDGKLPTGKLEPVAGTELDFCTPKPIGRDLGKGLASVDGGYDHTYVLKQFHDSESIRLAAQVHEPESGRSLEVLTDQPGLQFYTGNQLNGTIQGRGGSYRQFSSFSLEPEHFPNSVNHPNFPNTRLEPGIHYHTTTIFKFSMR